MSSPRILAGQIYDRPAGLRVVGRAQSAGNIDPGRLQNPPHGDAGQGSGVPAFRIVGHAGIRRVVANGRGANGRSRDRRGPAPPGHAHPRHFRADAQKPGLAPT